MFYRPLRWLFGTLLRLSEKRIADVTLRIEALLDWTDQRVSDDRVCLDGSAARLADLGFMSAVAPVVIPPVYERNVPPIEDLPEPYRDMVLRTRQRHSSRLALNLYRKLGPPSERTSD